MKTHNSKLLILSILSILSIAILLLLDISPTNFSYLLGTRIPKIIAVIISAICIGLSSLLFQTITGSRILTPSIMGLDAMHKFLQTFLVFFFTSSIALFQNDILKYFLVMISMIGISLLLQKFIIKSGKINILHMVLTGMILGTFLDSLSSAMGHVLDPNEYLILQSRLFESFGKASPSILIISVLLCILVLIILLDDIPKLDVLSLGYETSVNLGINYNKLVRKLLICAAILVSISTALVGPITFLGLLIANIAKETFKSYKHKILIPATVIIGILTLTVSLIISQRIFNNNVPVSVIINFIGGIYLLFILTSKRSKQ